MCFSEAPIKKSAAVTFIFILLIHLWFDFSYQLKFFLGICGICLQLTTPQWRGYVLNCKSKKTCFEISENVKFW